MLISVQDIKDFLGIVSNTDDNIILPLAQSAQNIADVAVDFELEGSTITEYQDGDGTDIIQLRITPVKSITSLHADWDRVYGSDSLIASGDYGFNANTGIIRAISCNFVAGTNSIKIVYVAGYNGLGQTAYTDLPYDLRQALIYLASAMYIEAKAGVNVFENQEIVYRPSYLKGEAQKILDGYRRITV